jgi:hypothetical protein
MTGPQAAAHLLALADRLEFPYGLDVPPQVQRDVERLRDLAVWADQYGTISRRRAGVPSAFHIASLAKLRALFKEP